MTSPGQQRNPVPDPTVLAKQVGADEGQESERAIADALSGIEDLNALPVGEHVHRFEAVHTALTDALNKAENLLSGSSGSGG